MVCNYKIRVTLKGFEKQILYLWLDDNWVFKITVSKVLSGHHDKNIDLIDGIGKEIEEDCGGVWSLGDLINDKKMID